MSSTADEPQLTFEYDVPAARWTWSSDLRTLHGLGCGEEPTTQLLLEHVVDEDREAVEQRLEACFTSPGCHSCTYRMRADDGPERRVTYIGQSEAAGGRVKRIYGFVIDVTDTMREHADMAVANAVEHRAVIEQAKGALMACFGIDDVAAFGLLRGYSSRSNTKLVDVAAHIAKGLSDERFSREEPVRSLLDILLAMETRATPR